MTSIHEIVFLGGNFAAVDTVHHLQRQVLPALKKAAPGTKFHITVVSPNSHFFFKIAAPRALINDKLIPVQKIFIPLADGFKQYGDAVTLLRGKATSLVPESRTVSVQLVGGEGAGVREIKYDSLFIGTGVTAASPLWSIHDDHEVTIKEMQRLHSVLPKTKTVLISGGGPVALETAGEISSAYPGIKITVVSAGEILAGLKESTIAKMKRILKDAKVELITKVKVTGATVSGESTVVQLSNGESKTVDLYIDGTGARKVNSEFVPKEWLDESGRVVTRDAYFRVRGDGKADVQGVYAVGDIVAGSSNTAMELNAQIPTAASSFAVDFLKKTGAKSSSGGLLSFVPGLGGKGVAQKEFKPMKDSMFVPFGPANGIGQILGWGVPTLMVKKAKAETFFVNMIEKSTSGAKYPQA